MPDSIHVDTEGRHRASSSHSAFFEWCATIESGVRRFIPEVVATQEGERRVIPRYAGQMGALVDRVSQIRFG